LYFPDNAHHFRMSSPIPDHIAPPIPAASKFTIGDIFLFR
jgi:hypothetical protein